MAMQHERLAVRIVRGLAVTEHLRGGLVQQTLGHQVADLAARTDPVPEVRERTLIRLREQARLQLDHDTHPEEGVRAEVIDPGALHRLPAPSPGDLFFDFEGDPLWVEGGTRKDWGLEWNVALETGGVLVGEKVKIVLEIEALKA